MQTEPLVGDETLCTGQWALVVNSSSTAILYCKQANRKVDNSRLDKCTQGQKRLIPDQTQDQSPRPLVDQTS